MLRKFMSYILITCMLFAALPISIVSAQVDDLVCKTTYEVSVVKSNGEYENISCTNSFSEAKVTMEEYNSDENNVATIFKGSEIIDTKYGLLTLRKKSNDYVTYIYSNSTDAEINSHKYDYRTYTNGNYGVYAAFLGANEGDDIPYAAKMVLSGYKGYVRSIDWGGRDNYDIIPVSLLSSEPYYENDNGDIRHYFYYAYYSSGSYHIAKSSRAIGPAPEYLEEGQRYYSFDGNYFYETLIEMLEDYKNDTYSNSINSTSPHFSYYQYLPHRTKTTYTATDINEYITNVKGYTEKAEPTSEGSIKSNQSMLYNEGTNYIDAQNTFGANALLTFSVSANESGWGRSSLARDKNNIFGHSASDNNPYGNAYAYETIRDSILYHADYFISLKYLDTETDRKYYGGHLGNKNSGINVYYASDPYWGEKAASHYYAFDKAYGLSDYKSNKIGIKTTSDTVNIRKEPTTASDVIYKLNNFYPEEDPVDYISNMPVTIIGEVTGESIDSNNIWYKIQTDCILNENGDAIHPTSADDPRPTYNWEDNYGYVHSSVILADDSYIRTSSKFYFNGLTWNEENDTMDISGFIVAQGTDNKISTNASYSLILKNVDTEDEYILPLDRWAENVPFTIPGENGYDYSGAWFKQQVDLSSVPEGDYDAVVRVQTTKYEATAVLRNIFGEEMSNKGESDNGRGYQFRTNYYEKEMPLEIFIRDDGLIAVPETPNSTNMVNTYKDISFNENSLNIRGNSYNVGVDYGEDITVERQIVLENINTYERFNYDIGSITNGDHDIVLRVSDGLSKTRAWFDGDIDLSILPLGTYSINIRTKAGEDEDAFELNDIFDRNLPSSITVNDKKISLNINKDKRYRIELTVE